VGGLQRHERREEEPDPRVGDVSGRGTVPDEREQLRDEGRLDRHHRRGRRERPDRGDAAEDPWDQVSVARIRFEERADCAVAEGPGEESLPSSAHAESSVAEKPVRSRKARTLSVSSVTTAHQVTRACGSSGNIRWRAAVPGHPDRPVTAVSPSPNGRA
jgi:hypothetical protein